MNAQAYLMEQYNKVNFKHQELHAEVEKYKYDSEKVKTLKHMKLKLKDKLTKLETQLGYQWSIWMRVFSQQLPIEILLLLL